MGATTTKTKSPAATPVLTTETLVLTKDQRVALESAFLETANRQAVRARALFPYVKYTIDQIVVAMYASADKTNDELAISTGERSTMARSLKVAKVWQHHKASELVDPAKVDRCLQLLTQICAVTPGQLARYAKTGKDGKPAGYRTVTVKPIPTAKAADQFDPFDVEIPYGAGEKAMDDVMAEFMERRVETDEGGAIGWLDEYRQAVVFAFNEHRRVGKVHNKRAADARKGNGEGKTQREPRNPGGKGKGKKSDEKPGKKAKAQAPAKPKTAAERPLGEATMAELLTMVGKRVADTSVAIESTEYHRLRDLMTMLDKRMLKVAAGKTAAEMAAMTKGKGKKRRVKAAPSFTAVAQVSGPATGTTLKPWSRESTPEAAMLRGEPLSAAQMNALLLTEQARGRITAEKRKEIIAAVHAGDMNPAQFRTRFAKIQARNGLKVVA